MKKKYKVTGNQYLSLKLTPKYTVHTYAQICLKKNLNYVQNEEIIHTMITKTITNTIQHDERERGEILAIYSIWVY